MTDTSAIESISDYAYAVRYHSGRKEKIVDYGVAHQGLGHVPPPHHVTIDAPTEGFEHWQADLSARVPGGMTLGELQRRLGETNQWLPIDADDDMTVAEVIAHNVNGPLRLTHGTCRDLLLGLRYVDATGTLITVGGRTVKNVAGYDVTRMMVGSLNTLGLIADANLRTSAIPPQVTRVEVAGVDPALFDPLMTQLLTCDAAPYSMEVRIRAGVPAWHIAYAGSSDGCEAQYRAMLGWLSAASVKSEPPQRMDGASAADMAASAQARSWRRQVSAHVKLVVPPAVTGSTVNELRRIDLAPPWIDALPAHGVIHIGADWTVEQSCAADASIHKLLSPHAGLRAWHRRPGNTEHIAPFAPPQTDWPMLGRIKQVMDPTNLFNPGRFL